MALKQTFNDGLKFLRSTNLIYHGTVKEDAVSFIEGLDAVWSQFCMDDAEKDNNLPKIAKLSIERVFKDNALVWLKSTFAADITYTAFLASFRAKYCAAEFKDNALN
jgi:hypothetical protein